MKSTVWEKLPFGDGTMRLRRDACLRLLPAFVFFCGGLVAAEPSTFPVYNEVQRIVDQHFGGKPSFDLAMSFPKAK